MNNLFIRLMLALPKVMVGFAVLFYLSTVLIAVVAGNEFSDQLMLESLPATFKLKSFLIVFVQPLVSVMAILFGAGLLWRLDQHRQAGRPAEVAE